jgi:hypothetical protein
MRQPTPCSFNVDLIRASLGAPLAAPYRHAFGAVPWLTAGTLAWPAADAEPVLEAWRRWTAELDPSVLTAVRLGAAEVGIDVALLGDPSGAAQRLSALRDLAPALDSVATLDRRALAAPACLAAALAPVGDMPSAAALTAAAAAMPDGVCFGLRAVGPHGVVAIGVAAATDLGGAQAAVDQAARGLQERVPAA